MTKKIMWDPGHGGADPGAVANGLKEKDLTLKIVKYAMSYMTDNYTGFEQRATRLTDVTVDLSKRDDEADKWGADAFQSIHINAGKGNGFESYIYNNLSAKSKPAATSFQNVVNNEVLAAMRKFGDIKVHGSATKNANFAVLRETNMTALLTENLFIDSSDSKYLKDEAFLKAVGEAHARGVAKFLGLPSKPKSQPKPVKPKEQPKTIYRVQVGAFANKVNADKLAAELKGKGYSAIVID
jgi:N-acetylmuramoyl-L-alanine amidase